MRLSVHAAGFGDRPAPGIIHALAGAGIPRVGLLMSQVASGTVAATAAAARDTGIEVLTVTRAVAFDLEDRAGWGGRRDLLMSTVDAAAALGAPFAYTTTGPAPGLLWDDAVARFTEAIAPVVAHAGAAGVRLAVENTIGLRADLGFVHRLADAVDLARVAGVEVIADLFAAWNERDLGPALTAGLDVVAYVQVADFVLGTLCTPGRAVPGDGDVPVPRQLGWLRAAGYDGVVELELLGPRIDDEGIVAANRRGLDALAAMLAQPLR